MQVAFCLVNLSATEVTAICSSSKWSMRSWDSAERRGELAGTDSHGRMDHPKLSSEQEIDARLTGASAGAAVAHAGPSRATRDRARRGRRASASAISVSGAARAGRGSGRPCTAGAGGRCRERSDSPIPGGSGADAGGAFIPEKWAQAVRGERPRQSREGFGLPSTGNAHARPWRGRSTLCICRKDGRQRGEGSSDQATIRAIAGR